MPRDLRPLLVLVGLLVMGNLALVYRAVRLVGQTQAAASFPAASASR